MKLATTTDKKINSFRDLYCWQEAHKLAIGTYKMTKLFPSQEDFALTSQMRRAAVSVSSNIAEGFSRRTKGDKTHFFSMALGSVTELQSQLEFAKDIGYLDIRQWQEINTVSVVVHKLINGLIKSTKSLPK